MLNPNSGYHDCPCRDCFEIAIGGEADAPALCRACNDAGCNPNGTEECQVEPDVEALRGRE